MMRANWLSFPVSFTTEIVVSRIDLAKTLERSCVEHDPKSSPVSERLCLILVTAVSIKARSALCYEKITLSIWRDCSGRCYRRKAFRVIMTAKAMFRAVGIARENCQRHQRFISLACTSTPPIAIQSRAVSNLFAHPARRLHL